MTSHVAESSSRSPYARYTCSTCRVKKTRCKLPHTFQSPSDAPLPTDKACERCVHLGLSCVVQQQRRRRRPVSLSSSRDRSILTQATPEQNKSDTALLDDQEHRWYRLFDNAHTQSSAAVMSLRRRPGAFLGELLARLPSPPPLVETSRELAVLPEFHTSMLPRYENK
jgi:hypothetical protein